MPFDDAKPGPHGAESNGPDTLRTITKAVINAFRADGLRYVGRIKLAREAGPRPAWLAEPQAPDTDGRGNWRVGAVRCTSDGDVYRGTCVPGCGAGGCMPAGRCMPALQRCATSAARLLADDELHRNHFDCHPACAA